MCALKRLVCLQVTKNTITSAPSTSTSDQETVNGLQYQSPTGEWWATSVKSKLDRTRVSGWCVTYRAKVDPPLLFQSHLQEQHQLPDGLVVAQPGGPVRGRRARLPVHPASRRPGVAQHRHRPLGAGHRLVQQHCLERRTSHRYAGDCGIWVNISGSEASRGCYVTAFYSFWRWVHRGHKGMDVATTMPQLRGACASCGLSFLFSADRSGARCGPVQLQPICSKVKTVMR